MRRRHRLRARHVLVVGALSALIAAGLAACTSPQQLDACGSAGTDGAKHTVEVAGDDRRYIVYGPDDLEAGATLPVVYLLHPLGNTAEEVAGATSFPEAAADGEFLVVAPQAATDELQWDVDSPVSEPESDLAFLQALMQTVADEHCGDPQRQYVAGISNGSMMAFAMACSGEFPIQAYGGAAAITYESGCETAPPASIVYFHGAGDSVVPFTGGETPVGPMQAVTLTLQSWAAHDGCPAAPKQSTVDAGGARWTWDCGAATIDAYVLADGGHTWPGGDGSIGAGATSKAVDATSTMVDFFELGDEA